MDYITNNLDKFDALAYQQIERLHLGGKKEHKSPVGGFCTCSLLFVLIGLTAWKGSQLFQYDGTHEYSRTLRADEEIFMSSSLKYVFYLTDLVQYFDFDSSKMDIYIEHTLAKYDDEGNHTMPTTRYDLRKCNSLDFDNT